MISFADQSVLWLLLPLALGMWSFRRVQRRSLAWLESHVSPRFRFQFSVYSRVSLTRHLTMLAAMGALLIVAAAGPSRPGDAEATDTEGRVLFLVDASASMFAGDVEAVFADQEAPKTRLDVARQVALDVISNLGGYRFALASYSGSGVVHLPMTTNQVLLEDGLRVLESHNYYKNTGSSLVAALDVVSHFNDPDGARLQVVMLGDGELPRQEEFDEALAALPPQGIIVHTIAIGSTAGQTRVIYDFRDIIQKKEDPAVLREYTTRRVDQHLKRIARSTGGFFSIAGPGVAHFLVERIRVAAESGRTVRHQQARKDLSPWLLAVVLFGFLFDTLVFGHRSNRRRRAASSFDLDRLGEGGPGASKAVLVLAVLLLSSCGESPRDLAHRENESGIWRDTFERFDLARPHYERSRGYEIEPEIPTHNLARSVALAGDVSEAHDLFQDALTLDPDLAEAMYNDGVTLYLWGESERDPEDCDLERTRELWLQAAGRFASSVNLPSDDKELASKARANHLFLGEALAEIDQLIAKPPEHCLSPSPETNDEGEGGGSSSGGEGESGGDDDEQSQDPAGAGESDDDDETQNGGSGGSANDQADGRSTGLSSRDLADIQELIQQITARGREGDRFHRRTRPEQFGQEDWSNPDPDIWW